MQSQRKLIVFGDSHIEVIRFANELGLLESDFVSVISVPGATAVGLRNPNSKTDAINIFSVEALKNRDATHLIIHLGEVDCGFVMWWRAQKYNEPMALQLQESLCAYENFIKKLKKIGFKNICRIGGSPPSPIEESDFRKMENFRFEVDTPLIDRMQLTVEYNMGLQKLAKIHGVVFLDITKGLVDVTKMTVSSHFISSDRSDHHLDKVKTVGIWAYAINSFLLR